MVFTGNENILESARITFKQENYTLQTPFFGNKMALIGSKISPSLPGAKLEPRLTISGIV